MTLRAVLLIAAAALISGPVSAQTLTQRGFIDGRGVAFAQQAANDPQRLVGDFLGRQELFFKPAGWLQFAGGLDVRANTHNEVEYSWRLDYRDRTVRRPALSLRRLNATFTHGPLTFDIGKQFIRWGKTDIVTPTDRFAPRDFVSVVDEEFLAVSGVRAVAQFHADSFDIVWVPWLTPSRLPLLQQRWTVLPAAASGISFADLSSAPPAGSQTGVRWAHTGTGYEYSASFFDGFNHLPDIALAPGFTPLNVGIVKTYPRLRSYGADAAVQARWFTLKGETAYFTTASPGTDEYVLYVLQLERQTGEWLFVGGYAGEVVTTRRALRTFAPDRGLTRAIVGRASYTISTNRSAAFETAVRQTGRGIYAKGEYAQARGQHWHATLAGVLLAGRSDDFLGQYRRNSHVTAALRYSF